MVLLHNSMIAEIRNVAELYAEREKLRLSRAEDAAWERIRVSDPARYKARNEQKFLFKMYSSWNGCIEAVPLDTLQEALEYVRLSAVANKPDTDYVYYIYDQSGNPVSFDITWIPEVRLKP